MNTRCPTCGSSSPSKRVLKAAFGMEVPEDEESTANDPFSDASDFEPKGYAFAKGGEVGKRKLFTALRGKLSGKESNADGAGKPSFAARMAAKYRSMHR